MGGGSASYTFIFLCFGCILVGANGSLRLDINPAKFDCSTSNTVTIWCAPNSTGSSEVKQVLVIEVFEGENLLLATVNVNDGLTYSNETAKRFQIDGQITQNAINDSFLRLTLLHPGSEDSGLYTCAMYYTDGTSVLRKETTNKFLSVTVTTDTFTRLHQILTELETDMMKKGDPEVRKSISDLEEKTQIEAWNIDKLKLRVSFVSAFTAAMSKTERFSPGSPIVFSEVMMYKGQGYDSQTGVYTAPLKGMYLFYLNLGNLEGNMTFSLTVNDQHVVASEIGHSIIDGWRDMNSMTSLLDLDEGDKVRVVMVVGDGRVRAGKYSVFGGHFVQATFSDG